MTDHAELRRLAKRADALHGTPSLEHVFAITKFRESVEPKAILALLDEIDRLKAENEALLLGMRAILNAYDYADQYNKEGVAVEVMEDLRTLFKGATQ
ncbi:TPA: hypothetical protein NH597_003315 [Pseudomonas aeruginosa]|nr:hypothetical protein [Pseudomonas aeruginosa]